jgi:hypothetical protein
VFTTFFSGIVPQLQSLGISEDTYQSLLEEIQQLRSMLAEQHADAALDEAIRRRLVEVIEKLLEIAPGIDVQSLFDGDAQT